MNTNSDLIGKMIYIPGGTHPRSIARNNMSKVLAIHLSSLQKWLWHRLMGYKVKDFEIGMHVVNMQDWQKVKNWGIAYGYDLPEGLVGGEKVRRNPTGIDIDYRFQPGDSEAAMYPVTAVGWYDCVKWCNAKSEMNGLEPVYLIQEKIYRTSRA